MSQLGISVMLHMLGGGSEHSSSEYYGQTIMSASIVDNRLCLGLSPSGKVIEIWDDGQSCCESRYVTTDDNVASLVGGVLQRIEAKDGPGEAGDYEEHETRFVEVGTDNGFITLVNHNEHNGYYGGFGLTITERKP